MVQPVVRRLAAAAAVLAAATFSARAGAEPLPSSCRAGLLLGVADDEARDVVAAVCSAARTRGTTGLVRVSVIGGEGRVRVAVARMADASGAEQTARVDAGSIAEATRSAPALLDAVDAGVAPAPAPAPAPTSAPASVEPAPVDAAPVVEPEAPPLQTKAGPPAAMVGVLGGASVLSNGASAGGGGASIGVAHRSAQGVIDFLYARAPLGQSAVNDLVLTMGARLLLSQSKVVPSVGGGWSYTDHEARLGTEVLKGAGIGVFGELGLLVPIERHQLGVLARLNLGLYKDVESDLVTSNGFTYRQPARTGGDMFTPSYALLGGYTYVFR